MDDIQTDMKTTKSELEDRVSRLQEQMMQDNLDAVLILQQADKFYFSGTVQDGVIFIPVDGEPVFMVRKSLERALEESELDNILHFKSYRQMPGILDKHGFKNLSKLGSEMDVMPVSIFNKLKSIFFASEICDASGHIKNIRMVKSNYEIKMMKKASEILAGAMEAVPNLLAEGMTEIELAAETEILLRRSGHQGIIRMRKWNQECFYGLILSGESGTISNYMDAPLGGMGPCPAAPRGASSKKIKKGEPVIIDMVSAYNGYVVDCTRTFCIGPLEPQLLGALEAGLKIQEEAIKLFKSGVNLREIYDMAVLMASEANLGEFFMGWGNSKVKFLGHGVGLELDELPVIAEGYDFELKENMTVAIEPKFLFPKIGAVGVENTWASKKGNPEKITDMADVLM
ncbi:MAG: aminopeptidase P family protein [Methanomassiliicoccales archaeon]|nr:MAG: aminopeptidase P family protein [Methanomassiliicoccales archaeon]